MENAFEIVYLLMGDIILSLLSVLASFMIRLELFAIFDTYKISLLWMLGVVIIVKPIVYYFFGIYRRLWRYASIRELVLIIMAVSAASLIVTAIMLTLFATEVFAGFPRSVLIIDWLISIFCVGGLRFFFRFIAERTSTAANGTRRKQTPPKRCPGDRCRRCRRNGRAGIAEESPVEHEPVGFMDDDPAKLNSEIHRYQGPGPPLPNEPGP